MSRTADSVAPPPSSSPAQRPPRLALLIATGFGLGYVPRAPGTAASLIATLLAGFTGIYLVIFWLEPVGFFVRKSISVFGVFFYMDRMSFFAVAAVIAAVGVWASSRATRYFVAADPQKVVIDEISGQMLTFVASRFDWQYLVAGFILFRVFDIWKPWPVRAAERLPGGWGIMADDWLAGIYAALCLWALRAAGM